MFKVIDRLLTFSHMLYWKKYIGATWWPCYNGDRAK